MSNLKTGRKAAITINNYMDAEKVIHTKILEIIGVARNTAKKFARADVPEELSWAISWYSLRIQNIKFSEDKVSFTMVLNTSRRDQYETLEISFPLSFMNGDVWEVSSYVRKAIRARKVSKWQDWLVDAKKKLTETPAEDVDSIQKQETRISELEAGFIKAQEKAKKYEAYRIARANRRVENRQAKKLANSELVSVE